VPSSDGKKNLVYWQKGQSGNPKGRRVRSLTGLLRKAGEKNEVFGQPVPNGMTVAEAFVEALWGHAIKGNPTYAAMILDRLEGKVPAKDELAIKARVEVASMTDDELVARIAELAGGGRGAGPGPAPERSDGGGQPEPSAAPTP
jgi:hypothetical protein